MNEDMFEIIKNFERYLNDFKVFVVVGFKGIIGIFVYLKMRM